MSYRSRLRAAAVAVTGILAASLLTVAAPTAAGAAGTASLSGTVTVPEGVAITEQSIWVDVWDTNNAYDYGTYVNSDGTYSVSGIRPGTYKILFKPSATLNLPWQWWKNTTDFVKATALTLKAGQKRTGVDVTLPPGATVTGKVTVPAGSPATARDVKALVYSVRGTVLLGQARVTASGEYAVSGLPAGQVKVKFRGRSDLLNRWHGPGQTYASASRVTLAAGEVTPGIDVEMVRAASISGRVSLPAGVDRVRGTNITAALYTADGNTYVASAKAGTTGKYYFDDLVAGAYTLHFMVSGVNALPQWWKGKTTHATADTITLAPGDHRSATNVTLTKGATLSGRVTLPRGAGIKPSDVFVTVYRGDRYEYVGSERVSSDGTYRVRALPGGSYKVKFSAYDKGTAAPQWYSGASDWSKAEVVSVATSKTRIGVSVALKIGGSISGTVTGTAGTKGGAYVTAYHVGGGGIYESGRGTLVGSGGAYRIDGLAPGAYIVQFSRTGSASGTAVYEKWWKDKPDAESANRVSVSAGRTTAGVSTNLDKKPLIQTLKVGTPTIRGTAEVGQTLTAKPGAWTSYTQFSYRWSADGVAIPKATKSTLTLTPAHEGTRITVTVTGTKVGYKAATRSSAPTSTVR